MKTIIIYILLSVSFIYANANIYHINIDKRVNTSMSSSQSQYNLANSYRDGRGVNINLPKAFHLYHKSALKNYPPAQYQLGMAFRHGLGVKANQELARYWFRKSARNRYIPAQKIFRRYYCKRQQIRQYRFRTIARY